MTTGQIYIALNYNSAVIPIIFVLIIDRSESYLLGNLQLLHTLQCDTPN